MAEGKDRYQDYKTDAADGKVNWMQQGKNAVTDLKADNLVYLLVLPSRFSFPLLLDGASQDHYNLLYCRPRRVELLQPTPKATLCNQFTESTET